MFLVTKKIRYINIVSGKQSLKAIKIKIIDDLDKYKFDLKSGSYKDFVYSEGKYSCSLKKEKGNLKKIISFSFCKLTLNTEYEIFTTRLQNIRRSRRRDFI